MPFFHFLPRTDWFDLSVSPVHVGMYNVTFNTEKPMGRLWSYWDGQLFYRFSGTPGGALKNFNDGLKDTINHGKWRGYRKEQFIEQGQT